MQTKPRISIIIATHNDATRIGDCLDSVLSQNMDELEVVAVDAGSSDGTKEILEQTSAEDDRVLFLADSMGSIGHAKNVALDHARAPYVMIMEPEDHLRGGVLELMCRELDSNLEVDLLAYEVDCYGAASGGNTNQDRNRIISEANRRDHRMRDMENRLLRSWMYDRIAVYRTDFLYENKIRHYEQPGYGRQDSAFRFLAMACGTPAIFAEICCDKHLDEITYPAPDAKAAMDVCDEFRYLKQRLLEDSELWWRMRLVFWQAYYDRNMLLYERLSDESRRRLSKRMQADLKAAIHHKEYSKEHFDIVVREDMELLLKSSDEFDICQKAKLKNRAECAGTAEEKLTDSICGETDIERLSRESRERADENTRRYRIDKPRLIAEMTRDVAPLRMLLGLSTEKMADLLGVSVSTYKSLETGKKEMTWDLYMALLFIFRFNGRTAPVVDALGLFPEALQIRMKRGWIGIRG